MRIRRVHDRPADSPSVERSSGSIVLNARPSLTEAEAAMYIGMSRAWLKKSRTRPFRHVIDAPPFVRAGARRVVYRREDLDAWQARHLEHVGPGAAVEPGQSQSGKASPPR